MTSDNTHTNVYPATKAARMANKLVRQREQMNKDELLQFPTASLSDYLNPFMAGDLITIIGRPQNGKSLISMWLLMNALEKIRDTDNQAVILVNLEVSIERAILQLMSFMSGISMTQALRGELTPQEYRGLGIAALKVGTLPLFIIGHSTARSKDKKRARPDLSPPNLSKAIDFILNDYTSEQGKPIEPVLIVIDYLQRIHKPPRVDRAEHMLVCVDWSKDLAYWAGCPVILNVQAGRKVDERPVPMPSLADGQWTSNVEQSSDFSFGVWMPKTYKLAKVPKIFPTYPLVKVTDNLLLLPVLKQKDGPAGDVFHLHVIPQTLTVTELPIPSH